MHCQMSDEEDRKWNIITWEFKICTCIQDITMPNREIAERMNWPVSECWLHVSWWVCARDKMCAYVCVLRGAGWVTVDGQYKVAGCPRESSAVWTETCSSFTGNGMLPESCLGHRYYISGCVCVCAFQIQYTLAICWCPPLPHPHKHIHTTITLQLVFCDQPQSSCNIFSISSVHMVCLDALD